MSSVASCQEIQSPCPSPLSSVHPGSHSLCKTVFRDTTASWFCLGSIVNYLCDPGHNISGSQLPQRQRSCLPSFLLHWVFVRFKRHHTVKDLWQMKHTTQIQREATGKINLGNPQECWTDKFLLTPWWRHLEEGEDPKFYPWSKLV